MSLLRGQADVSPQVPMPTDRVDDAAMVVAVPAEVVTWLYVATTAYGSATGQAAGTIVLGNLNYKGVINASKGSVGSFNTTSFSFAASTRFDTQVSIPETVLSELQLLSPADQKAKVTLYLTVNGQFAIDHRRGQIWGRPKAVLADDTVAYSYTTPVSNAAVYNSTPPTKTDGQGGPIQSDSLGNLQVNQYTKIAGEDLTNDVMKVQVQATYTVPLTASALVKTGAGQLFGLVVNSCAAGATIKVWDNTSAATTVLLDTITFTAAVAQGPSIIALPAVKFTTGCYITIAVAAMSVTPLWN
jgi:hypothetical protein